MFYLLLNIDNISLSLSLSRSLSLSLSLLLILFKNHTSKNTTRKHILFLISNKSSDLDYT